MTKIEILENGNVKLTIPMSFRHCAGRKRIIVPDDSEKLVDPLVLNLARAFRWQELIDSGTYSNAIELARAVGKDTAYVARTVRLTLLAPEIIHAILHGTLKKSISMETLRKSCLKIGRNKRNILVLSKTATPSGGRRNLAAFLRLRTACRGGCGKVRVSCKERHKSPCEADL